MRKDFFEACEPPLLLHPRMADLYRTKVGELAASLQRERGAARSIRNATRFD
jgi:hypothetical protein